MPKSLIIYAFFGILTVISGCLWYLIDNDFVGGLFGNMLVGFITLICVNLILETTLDRQRKPGIKAALRAATEVHANGVKLVCGLYGAAVKSGRVSRASHAALSRDDLDFNLASILASTPVRDISYDAPQLPAFVHMASDAQTIRTMVDTVLAAHGQYLTPELTGSLFEVSRSSLVAFILTSAQVSAIPETFPEDDYRSFVTSMNLLKGAVTAVDPKVGAGLRPRGYFQLLDYYFESLAAASKPTP